MSNRNRDTILSNLASWIGVVAAGLIIFAFVTGLSSVQEVSDFLFKTPTPQPLLSGSPKNLLPDSEDIPNEMIKSETYMYSNEDIAKRFENPVEVFNKLELWGRSTNFHQEYLHKNGCASKSGYREINLQSILLKTGSGAKEYLDWSKTALPALLKASKVDSIDEIGESGFIYWYETSSDCTPADELLYVGIGFQRYNARGNVWVGTVKGTVSEDDMQSLAIQLAKLMDLRFVAEAR